MDLVRSFLITPRSKAVYPERIAKRRGKPAYIFTMIAMAVFAGLFTLVKQNRTASTDAAITLRAQKADHPYFDRLMTIVSWPGFPPQSRIIPPTLSAILFAMGMRLEAIFQLAAWGRADSFLFKRLMRQRPGKDHPEIRVRVANIGGTSFPSGHVIIYTGVYGFLAFLANIWIKSDVMRKAVVGFLLGMIALVGPSRVYLGHHWFTDTLASYLLGSTYVVALTSLYRRVKRWTLADG